VKPICQENDAAPLPQKRAYVRKPRTSNTQPAAFMMADALAYLGGIHEQTIYRLVKDGKLKRVTGLRHYMFTKTELDRFLAQ
jgi:excisionase family DNA binding protein